MRTPGLAMTVAVLASSHALFAADTELEPPTWDREGAQKGCPSRVRTRVMTFSRGMSDDLSRNQDKVPQTLEARP